MSIRVINRGEKIVMRLSGYLDGSFAWEIVRKVENYRDKEVVLDFKEIRHVHAFGWDVLKARIGPKVKVKGFKALRDFGSWHELCLNVITDHSERR